MNPNPTTAATMTTTTTAATAPTTMAHTGIMERAESTVATTSSLSHFSNAAISNLTTNMVVTTAANIAAISKKEFQTPNSLRKARTFHAFPIVNTPTPPSRFRKVVNPFEEANAERMHLPLIDR